MYTLPCRQYTNTSQNIETDTSFCVSHEALLRKTVTISLTDVPLSDSSSVAYINKMSLSNVFPASFLFRVVFFNQFIGIRDQKVIIIERQVYDATLRC